MKFFVITLAIGLLFIACKQDKPAPTEKTAEIKVEQPVAKKFTLTPFSTSIGYSDASIESMTYKGGKFSFKIKSVAYQLGVQTPDAPQKMCANSGQGQHIHLIIDNEPYAAKYVADFDYDVADGEHYLLAFLSRSYHESIKTPKAATVQKIAVKDKAIQESKPVEEPMLFYSRPKGTYVGSKDTKKVMLDFYVANLNMADGYTVKADINGETHILDKWKPYYIEGLPVGENTITLTLMKGEQMVNTPLNPVTRKFTLKADELENG